MNLGDLYVKYEDFVILALIILIVVLVFLILVYFTFFIVKIRGAQEEKDDTLDLLKLGIVKYRAGNWYLDLGILFNENAVLQVDFGWSFLMLFEGWKINGLSGGDKIGVVPGIVSKRTVFLKRKIRRN